MVRFFLLLLLLASFQAFSQRPDVVFSLGHTDQINSLTFTPDGKRIVTGGNDNQIKVWETGSGKLVRTISGMDGRLTRVKVSPDGKLLGAFDNNGSLRIFELRSGKQRVSFSSFSSEGDFDFSKDSERVLFSNDSKVAVGSISSGEVRYLDSSYPMRLAMSPLGDRYFILDHQGNLFCYEFPSGKLLIEKKLFDKLNYSPGRMLVSQDGSTLAIAFDDVVIRVFSTSELKLEKQLKGHGARIWDMEFDHTGKNLVVCDHEKNVWVWDVVRGEINAKAPPTVMGSVAVACHPFQDVFVYNEFKEIHLADLRTGKDLNKISPRGNRLIGMAINPSGELLATASDDITIKIWDLSHNRIERVLDGFFPVAISPKENVLVCMSNALKLAVYDPVSGIKLKELDTEYELIQNISFDPSGKYISGAGFMGVIKIWELESGKLIKKITGHTGGIYGTSFSPDGTLLASCGMDNTVRLWNWREGKQLANATAGEVLTSSVTFSKDGSTIFSTNWDGTVKQWSVPQLELIREYKGHTNTVLCSSLSKDGHILASGGGSSTVKEQDNSIRIWDTQKGIEICRLENPTGQITQVLFDPSKDRLFSASWDGVVKIWDIQECTEAAELICVNRSEHVIITREQYYTASREALQSVSFRLGDELLGLDQFELRLNRPDKVAEKIGKTPANLVRAYNYAWQKRLKREGFQEEELGQDFHHPEIEFREEVPLLVNTSSVKIKVHAEDKLFKLDRVLFFVNGVPYNGSNGFSIREKLVSSLDLEMNIPLLSGRNLIEVKVINEKGVASQVRSGMIIRSDKQETKSRLFIAGIGVSSYMQSNYSLKYPVRDAEELVKKLASRKELYAEIKTKLLLDSLVTRENILQLGKWLSDAGPDDIVILFIAGHGLLDENLDYFYATWDIDFTDPGEKGISYFELEAILDKIKAMRKLLLMDTCHSGELDKEEIEEQKKAELEIKDVEFRTVGNTVAVKDRFGVGNSLELMKMLFDESGKGTGATVISSSGGAEFSMESEEWKNGLFTYCLLNSLNDWRTDQNQDRVISVSEWRRMVNKEVYRLSNGLQQPTSREENLLLDYRVW